MNKNIIEKQKEVYNPLEETVNNVVSSMTKDLDDLVAEIKLKFAKKQMISQDIQYYIVEIPLRIYYLNTEVERIALKESIAKEFTKEKYNDELIEVKGTVNMKIAAAEMHSQEHRLIELMYSTTVKRIRAKIVNAEDLLSSCKKVLSYRITEMEMER